MSQILDRVLTAARQLGASDVHLKAGLPPIFRIKGDLRTVRDVPALTREVIARFAVHMMNDRQRADFEQHLEFRRVSGSAQKSWTPGGGDSHIGAPGHDEFEIERLDK